ncbi:MAG: hypothetical protein ACPGLV_17835 [Bacteroidia bacterium]
MKPILLVFSIAIAFSFARPQAYTIRDAYHNIPIEYLPSTKAYLNGKSDNKENRDKILTYHNKEREFIKLNHSGSKLTGQLMMFVSGTDIYVVVEHSFCRSGKCQNEFVILMKKGDGFVDVTASVLKDFELSVSKWKGTIKKEMKNSYGTNDYFESLGLNDNNTLKEYLIWQLDEQSGHIKLNESSLPYTLATYSWDEKKGEFKKD